MVSRMSRTKNSIKNFKYSVIGQSMGLIISFISRIFFIKILGNEYLGLNGLFTNILTVLSLVELGVGNAIIYSLYKPISDNDIEKCKTLMYMYKKFYTIIGVFVLIAGISITPFLNVFIKEIPKIPNINLIYILFVLNTSISYFFSYKRNLIIANQNRYVATFYRYIFYFILNLVQILYLIITNYYIGFLVIQVLFTLFENLSISIKADKMYPYLKENNIKKLDIESKNEIERNVKALIIHKIGNVAVNSTDNIILSKYVSIVSVGLYSNYYMIVYALDIIISQIFTSMTASIGDLCAKEKEEKQYEIFNNVNFLNFWIYITSSVCLLILFNPFITIWIGEEYLFSNDIVVVLVINFYVSGMRKCVLAFREAKGLYYQDRFKPILESILNIVISIILAKRLGVLGVFIGTSLSSILTCLWIEPYILHKYGFELSSKKYFETYLKQLTILIIVTLITCFLTSFIHCNIYMELILKLIICITIPNSILFIIYRKSKEYRYFINKVTASHSQAPN